MRTEDSPRFNCGWNIHQSTRAAVIDKLNAWRPRGEIERRDKKICELAFKENMNTAQIERLRDPELVNQWGRPLTSRGMREIIYTHFPQLRRKRGYSVTTEGKAKRADLSKNIEKITANKPKICAVCGSLENLRLHHIVPVDHGGTNDPVNLIYLCADCHNELHAKIYKTWGDKGQSKRELMAKKDEPILARQERYFQWRNAIHTARAQA